jgi:hypothetical protein
MKPLAALLLALLAGAVCAQNAVPAKPKQVVVNVKLFQGDPSGSREAGTLKCLVDTRCVTLDGRPFTVVSGGETPIANAGAVRMIPFGHKVIGTPRLAGAGTLQIKLQLENSTVQTVNKGFRRFTEAVETEGAYQLGDPVKIQLGTADKQVWAELVFEERE